jgi:hypothetical protein
MVKMTRDSATRRARSRRSNPGAGVSHCGTVRPPCCAERWLPRWLETGSAGPNHLREISSIPGGACGGIDMRLLAQLSEGQISGKQPVVVQHFVGVSAEDDAWIEV